MFTLTIFHTKGAEHNILCSQIIWDKVSLCEHQRKVCIE